MAKRVRICPKCGYQNSEFETLCIKCPTSLMNIPVRTEDETEAKPVFDPAPQSRDLPEPGLRSEAGVVDESATQRISAVASLECLSTPGFRFTVQPGASIGRQGEINVKTLPNSQFISRRHATFLHEAGIWYIRDENSTEGTCVNGIKIGAGIKQPLKDGDQISLAITTFVFRSKP